MTKEENDGRDLDAQGIISETFSSLDQTLMALEQIPVKAELNTSTLLTLLETGPIIFDDKNPAKFLAVLNNLSEEIGNANHMVLAIQLAREKVKPVEPVQSFLPQPQQTQQLNPIAVLQTQPPKGGGFWDYQATRKWGSTMENVLLAKSLSGVPPDISTGKQVVDILDFGRQLIPEFNRVQTFFRKSIDRLYFYNDAGTRERLHSELVEHLNKLAGIIRAFTRTIAEYRKELVSDRKAEIAKASLALMMAQAMTSGRGSPISIDPTSLAMQNRVR